MSKSTDKYPQYENDVVVPFSLQTGGVRGRIARLNGALDNILNQHNYPPLIEKLLAETVILGVLIAQSIKESWKLSLQVRGSGALRILATDYVAPTQKEQHAQIRGYASFDQNSVDDIVQNNASLRDILGKGYFAIIITQGNEQQKPYQGITPLEGDSLAEIASTYFMDSEQLPTYFKIGVRAKEQIKNKKSWQGSGIMVQKLPKTSFLSGSFQNDDGWMSTLNALEKINENDIISTKTNNKELFFKYFNRTDLQIFTPHNIQFGCTCNADRVRQSLSIYSQKDIKHMTRPDGKVGVKCQFCAAEYDFFPETLGQSAYRTQQQHHG